MTQKVFDVLIIGGGVNGLSTAYSCSFQSNLKVGILEQFSVGNAYGGSNGESRIFRTTYPDSAYLKLAKRCRNQDWAKLEKELGYRFIHPNPACYFGEGATFEKYLQVIGENKVDIDILDAPSARRMYPQFHFPNTSQVVHDQTGGVIAAKEMLQALTAAISKRGVKIYENTKLLSMDIQDDPISLSTSRGKMLAKRLVITAGAWLKQIVNTLITPMRQTVAYFQLQGPQLSYQIPHFPNWAFIGDGLNQVFYGLPTFKSQGIKIAQHITIGKEDNPDQMITDAPKDRLDILKDFIERHFTQPIDRLVHSETCLYAMAPNEGFIIDLLPTDQRIAVGAACSGHGFKFAPLTGRLLAELVLNGKTTVPEFEEAKSLFTFPKNSPGCL